MSGVDRDPVPLRDALAAVGRDLELPDPETVARLTEVWRDVVGDAAAAHARVRSLRRGKLVVAVDDPAWASQLRYREAALREALASRLGPQVVSDVSVVVEARK